MPSSYHVSDPIDPAFYRTRPETVDNENRRRIHPVEYMSAPYDSSKQVGPTLTRDPVEVDINKDDNEPERGQWGSKAEFILSCVGLSVGIGNVWRFPFLAYENGGGAFLLPYFILLLLVGKPMYYMEVAIGQYSSLGPLSIWKCAPVCRGVGFAMVVVSLIVAIYYNVIMGYTLFYIGVSFAKDVPWNKCYEWWGAEDNCFVREKGFAVPKYCNDLKGNYSIINEYGHWKNVLLMQNVVNKTSNASSIVETSLNCTTVKLQTASEQFWEKYVLKQTDGIHDLGEVRWQLALCLMVSWLIVFLCLMKGVKSSGKVVYFTATFPYLILIILLIRGVTLNGAMDGITYFFVPSWEKLLDITVWKAAAEQLFFSLSVSWGGLIMFGSYNKFRNKVHYDAFFVSSLDFFTSVIAGIVIFSVLGNMSHELGIDVKHVAKGGQGLAFVAYPEALARLPIPQLWSVLFFFMLFTLGLDSEFALLETVLTAIYDEIPKSRKYKIPITGALCAVCFLIGLPCVTEGGSYVLNLMDTYGGGFAVLFISISELIALHWIYGVNRFSDNLTFMLGFRPNIYWRVCWVFIAPVLLALIFVYSLTQHSVIKYDNKLPYPDWADGIGWILALISMVQIPTWAFIVLAKNKFNFRKAATSDPSWGPGDPERRKELIDYHQRALNMSEKGYDNPAVETTDRY